MKKREVSQQTCTYCHALLGTRFNTCSGCGKAFYCNAKCRKADYKRHKREH